MIYNNLSICKRFKNVLAECRRHKKVFTGDTKSICKPYKTYLQTIRGTYQKRRQSEIGSLRTQPPASWKVSFLVCGTSLCLFSLCIFLQPWQKCLYFSLPPPSSVPGGQAVIIVCNVIVRENNQPHTSAHATA